MVGLVKYFVWVEDKELGGSWVVGELLGGRSLEY